MPMKERKCLAKHLDLAKVGLGAREAREVVLPSDSC